MEIDAVFTGLTDILDKIDGNKRIIFTQTVRVNRYT